ncbi:hypothetical protein [Bacillus sp. ISL-7]|uniref:hypothetical protein n=1 Tax=Bacillus sp. ISL-7 TaxID=2819136 RepID=UPI001BE7E452|nr:hypothetical protein [Bacillus sp. ISL-7]MBT2736151.1 hypothetical protein [Bacillus sp. ISL-7]
MSWNNDDFTNYHNAPSAWYSVQANGKVDISEEMGTDGKISLQPWGMYKLVKDWLKSGHQLPEDERQELIDLLTKNKKESVKLLSRDEFVSLDLGNKIMEHIKNNPIDPIQGIREYTAKNQEEIKNIINSIKK